MGSQGTKSVPQETVGFEPLHYSLSQETTSLRFIADRMVHSVISVPLCFKNDVFNVVV